MPTYNLVKLHDEGFAVDYSKSTVTVRDITGGNYKSVFLNDGSLKKTNLTENIKIPYLIF